MKADISISTKNLMLVFWEGKYIVFRYFDGQKVTIGFEKVTVAKNMWNGIGAFEESTLAINFFGTSSIWIESEEE